MQSAALAQNAYGNANAYMPLGRDTEYRAFAKVTRKLAEPRDGRTSFASLVSALHENNRLWGIIAEDVASGGNELDAKLRAQLFYLFEFTALHTRKVIAGEASPEILVEINTSIMRGLRASKAEA